MKIIVTGCSGFVGYNLCKELLVNGHDVIGIDCYLENYYIEKKEKRTKFLEEFPNFEFHKLDVAKDTFPEHIKKADHVVHLAAKDFYYEDEEQKYSSYIINNVVGTSRVFEWAGDLGIDKFIFTSTHSVYGKSKKKVFTEKDIVPKPVGPHGASKLSTEEAVKFLSRTHNVSTIILRVATIYGPDMLEHQVIPYFMRTIDKKQHLELHTSPQTTRDFVYVDDVIDAIISCFDKRLTLQTINIGYGKSYSLEEIASKIGKIFHEDDITICFEDTRVEHIDKITADEVRLSIARAKKLLDYKPKIDIDEGLKRSIDWYIENDGF